MLRHIIPVIAATSSDPERYLANGFAAQKDRKIQSGISTKSAIKVDLNAGETITRHKRISFAWR
jgi:hypothetical protein